MHSEPWQIAPQLTQNRIQQITQLIVQARAEVTERHEPPYDTPLVLGVRAYEWCRMRLIEEAQSNKFPWLFILTHEGRFTFAIGESSSNAVPVRFSRNDPEQLPNRKLITSEEWNRQMSLPFFEEKNKNKDIIWFIIVDAPSGQDVQHAYFVGYNKYNEIICKWAIPLEESVLALSDINEPLSQPVDVAPAKPKLKIIKQHKAKDNDEK